ncbi:MAG TPA: WecB/TagA/CpsF family glycosyltransferase [bacterium]|mgnify:CR=1 FL=1|nr:WecB/TagA/CpsF family glycosyltransferase [bacterium]
MNKKSVSILDCRIDCFDFNDTIEYIDFLLHGQTISYAVTLNPEIILLAQSDPTLKSIINSSSLSTADGAGLLWANGFLKSPNTNLPVIKYLQIIWQFATSLFLFAIQIKSQYSSVPERVTGTDLVPEIAKLCAKQKYQLYLLGAGPGVAVKTADRLRSINPALNIVGTSANDWLPEYDQTNIDSINQSGASCLLIAYGAPRDQFWLARNKDKLINIRFAMGVGGAFDFIAEETSILGGKKAVRAPGWLRRLHLEWLHRLYLQPDRLSRIFNAVIVFPFRVLVYKLGKKNPT